MAKGRESRADHPVMPSLTVGLAEAEAQIDVQLEAGQELLQRAIQTQEQLDKARSDRTKWNDYNTTLLRKLFDSTELADEYAEEPGVWIGTLGPTPLHERVQDFHQTVERSLTRLESVRARLGLYESPGGQTLQPQPGAGNKRVFVVHGYDKEAKQLVARFLEHLDLDAIILHEKPSAGRTIIEKFEDYSDAGYAVVILTPDDICSGGDNEPSARRPRQNVVFELGFFVGRLGRERVCALYKADTEIPSDYQGVVYVPMDEAGGWQFELAREMKHAGMDVDLNKAL